MKLKKIQEHYYILSDETIKKGDWFIEFDLKGTRSSYCNKPFLCDVGNTGTFILTKDINFPFPEHCKKITHSTQPLEVIGVTDDGNNYIQDFDKIKPLNLSEVEELIYGYSAEKMSLKKYPLSKLLDVSDPDYEFRLNLKQIADTVRNVWIEGFKAAMEINKDKLFTIEDMEKAFNAGYDLNTWEQLKIPNDERDYLNEDDYIKPLLPKTEWNCSIDSNGKIKLI